MMKYFLLTFSLLFMLFFAIPFPMLLYYNIKSEDPADLMTTNPWVALSLLIFAVLLWLILLTGYFRKWILVVFKAKRNIDFLRKEGIHREAKILSATKVPGDEAYELELSFKNLVNTEIIQKISLKDGQPAEHRFEEGKKVDLLIDETMTHPPYFIIASTNVSIHKKK